jgi:alpha-L-rhamnosidase
MPGANIWFGVRRRWIWCLFCLVALALAGVVAYLSTVGATPTVGPEWPANPSWEAYVPAPLSSNVRPVAVLDVTHGVSGAHTLVNGSGAGAVTLTDRPGSSSPSLTVDYGKDVGGVPFFIVRSASGSPTLQATYSEGLQYLGPSGDDSPSLSGAGDPSRVDDLILAYPGRMTTGLIQGGERYERITLISPGSVTLSAVGIEFTAVRATAQDYRGWFDSSSPLLNRIWYDGAYTTQLDEIPENSVPPAWQISDGALEAVQGQVGLLGRGRTWSDYTMAFDTRVVDNSAGWVVRADAAGSGYLLLLHASGSGRGSRAILFEATLGPRGFSEIGSTELPAGFDAGLWHHITTVVSGSAITTTIDGRPVARFDLDSLPGGTHVYRTGTVGFATLGATAIYRDLDVTSSRGASLYSSSLSQPDALAAFPGPDVNAPDTLPAVVDGAKRDRVVWSDDVGAESLNIFVSVDNAAYVQGSLQTLASNQVADGETGTSVDPTVPLGTYPFEGSPPYSTSYSMDTVDDLALYYLYTGDLSFVRAEWPMVTRELAYNHTLVDRRGLLVTDDQDGEDWDYYDGARTGEATSYNDIYYETLTDAATMASALGLTAQAGAYRSEAAHLRTAINQYLFDSSIGLYGMSNLEPTVVAQDANSLAVLYGIAPAALRSTILTRLEDVLPMGPFGPEAFTANAGYRSQISPFVTSEEVQALFLADQSAAAVSLLTKLWGYMDSPGPDYTGTDWELLGANGQPGLGDQTSLAHGWSSGATADLTSYVLGVTPDTAGYEQWTVQPHPGALSWVEGDVPTPDGRIAVRWAQSVSSGRFNLQVDSPSGTRGVIEVPVSSSGTVVTSQATLAGKAVGAPRAIRTSAGAHFQSIAAIGGVQYNISVVPNSRAGG